MANSLNLSIFIVALSFTTFFPKFIFCLFLFFFHLLLSLKNHLGRLFILCGNNFILHLVTFDTWHWTSAYVDTGHPFNRKCWCYTGPWCFFVCVCLAIALLSLFSGCL
jgi:hypothetical protein